MARVAGSWLFTIVAAGVLGGCGSSTPSDGTPAEETLLSSRPSEGPAPPWQGSQRALVIMLEWANVTSTVTRDDVAATFFATGNDATSVRQFFLENASGRFDLSGEVLGWRRADASWDDALSCSPRAIAERAWSVFAQNLDASQYDADHDGKVDNLFVVHSGRTDLDRTGPECTFTSHPNANRTVVFQSRGVGAIGDALPIGYYIHEGGHAYYGLPDLYGDHYHGRYGIGMWGMMALGAWGTNNAMPRADLFRVPAHFEPYSKVRIGWVSPRVISETQRSVVLRPIERGGEIVAVPVRAGINYYLEYRSQHGFSTGHRGHGLLLWRNYKLVQADGRDDLNEGTDLGHRPLPPIDENFGDATDPFPGDGNVSSYSDAAAGISFENVKRYEDRIELDVVVSGPRDPFRILPDLEVFDGVERL